MSISDELILEMRTATLSPAIVLQFFKKSNSAWTLDELESVFSIQRSTRQTDIRKFKRFHGIIESLLQSEILEHGNANSDDQIELITLSTRFNLIQSSLELSLSELIENVDSTMSKSHFSKEFNLVQIKQDLEDQLPPSNYRADLLASLAELDICLQQNAFIAVMCLSGKILEICLKHILSNANIIYDPNLMIGKLIAKIRESNIQEVYFDPGLGNIANIINQSRIPAVHLKDNIPVPSKNQAKMVVHAVLDLLNRTMKIERSNN